MSHFDHFGDPISAPYRLVMSPRSHYEGWFFDSSPAVGRTARSFSRRRLRACPDEIGTVDGSRWRTGLDWTSGLPDGWTRGDGWLMPPREGLGLSTTVP